MEISENFAFLKQEFPHAAESASYAERHVYGDPRASCFHARHAPERLVMRVYKVDKTLSPPKITNLDASRTWRLGLWPEPSGVPRPCSVMPGCQTAGRSANG